VQSVVQEYLYMNINKYPASSECEKRGNAMGNEYEEEETDAIPIPILIQNDREET
jgi:hypothetical protein